MFTLIKYNILLIVITQPQGLYGRIDKKKGTVPPPTETEKKVKEEQRQSSRV